MTENSFNEHHQPRINDSWWAGIQRCPRCNITQFITAKDLRVTSMSDQYNEQSYQFRVKCNCCQKLSIVVPKNRIPYKVKENVLAENTPIIDDGFLC